MSPPSGASGAPVGQSHGPSALSELQQPSTSPEFQRDWRRHCTTATDRVKYLQLCGAENLPRLDGGIRRVSACRNGGLHCSHPRRMMGQRSVHSDCARSIFKVEINAPLLSEILVALEEVVGASEGPEPTLPFALDCLGGLAQGGRFSLNVRLLAKSGKEAARALLGRAAAQGGDVSARAQALASQYSIHM